MAHRFVSGSEEPGSMIRPADVGHVSRSVDAEPRTTSGQKHRLGPRQRTAIISWAAFAATFAGVRAVTLAIKNDIGPCRDAASRGVHLHHYLWGIKLLAASGGLAIHGPDRFRTSAAVAAGYGAGAALVIDEFALLVHLEDVYWTKRGRVSIMLASGLIGAVGTSFTLIPAWHRHRTSREQDRGPHGGFGSGDTAGDFSQPTTPPSTRNGSPTAGASNRRWRT